MKREKRDFRWRRLSPLQIFVYLLLRILVMVLDMFPYSMAPRISRALARFVCLIDRKHPRIAAKNLENTRGIVPTDEIPEFIGRVYDHVALGFVEMLMLPRLMERRQLSNYVRLERFEVMDRILKEGRGVIVTIGHLGNWELVGLGVTIAGYPLNSLARPVENPWVDRYLNRFRTRTGQRIIPKYSALSSMVRALQRNEILVVQVDQDARHVGVFVEFFGRPASTHRSPATLSLKYGTPILVANIYREGGIHYCRLSDPLCPDDYRGRPDPVQSLTQAYTSVFEGFVRERPAQWFWMHDRWKTAERTARVDAEAVATPKA